VDSPASLFVSMSRTFGTNHHTSTVLTCTLLIPHSGACITTRANKNCPSPPSYLAHLGYYLHNQHIAMALTTDQKLVRSTKFPDEFNQKVDMTKVQVNVLKT